MEHPPRRDSRVADMLLAGTYRYIDFPGAEPQLVEVDWELGECQVRFHDMEPEDAGLILHPQDMAGTFERGAVRQSTGPTVLPDRRPVPIAPNLSPLRAGSFLGRRK